MAIPVIGQALRVRLREGVEEYYNSRLVEATADHLYLDVPLHHETHAALRLSSQDKIVVEFHARDGAKCTFVADYLDELRDPTLMYRINRPKPTDVLKEQRREFVRVPADIEVKLHYGDDSGDKIQRVHTRDISGGGMAVLVPQNVNLRTGSMVQTSFAIDANQFNIKCFVIRVAERNERGYSLASLQFMNIDESNRRKIIQYTFSRQRLIGKTTT